MLAEQMTDNSRFLELVYRENRENVKEQAKGAKNANVSNHKAAVQTDFKFKTQ